MKSLLVLLIVAGASLHSDLAIAKKAPGLRADQIQFTYEPPKNPEHETVFRLLKDRQVLEKFKQFLSPLRLPRPLRLKLAGCAGDSNAWYEDDVVTVCYEYIDEQMKN